MADQTGLTLSHLKQCDGTDHVDPIGFYRGGPSDGEHGEPYDGGVRDQCMCGHVPYFTCPDWLAVHNPTEQCAAGDHDDCDRRAVVEYTGEVQDEACPCDCHIEVSAGARTVEGRARPGGPTGEVS